VGGGEIQRAGKEVGIAFKRKAASSALPMKKKGLVGERGEDRRDLGGMREQAGELSKSRVLSRKETTKGGERRMSQREREGAM